MLTTKKEWLALRSRLLFDTPARAFAGQCELARRSYHAEFIKSTPERKQEIVQILSGITVDMRSYLTRWQLRPPRSSEGINAGEIKEQAERNCSLLRQWGLVANVESIAHASEPIARSSLLKLSEMADRDVINNRWGNDSATGLTEAIRRGAVLVTTNPVMINAARKEDPVNWDQVRDQLKESFPTLSPEQRVSQMTMRMVLENCRELRPIYEATNGEYGYVSLQVNPRANREASLMVEEAEGLYELLGHELNGTPNAVFKIPATEAGLDAVRALTAKGIGCTVTVNCSVDQNLAFGELIEQGTAKLSFLVVMSGRLDDPIRDELQDRGVADAAEIAKWASVGVIRRSYDLLYRQRRYQRSALLTASLRGPWNIEGSITDEKAPVFITCFPDKAAEYDSVERNIVSHMKDELPHNILAKLMKSQIFQQAYEVGGLAKQGFDKFLPVTATLAAFAKSYDEFLAYNR